MYLPSTCRRLATLRATTSLSISTTAWKVTDLSYSFTLSRDEHIFVRYQHGANGFHNFLFTRLVIDSVPMKHTTYATDNDW